MYRMNHLVIFENDEAKIVDVINAEQIKVQAVGTGIYTVKGRLASDCEWDTICCIRARDFEKSSDISDTAVWIGDVSGYSAISVEATNFDKIYATLIG